MRLALAIALTACTAYPELDRIESSAGGCVGAGCGDNTANVEGSDVSWFRLDHNLYRGVRYLHFARNQAEMDARIVMDNLDVSVQDADDANDNTVAGNRLRWGSPGGWHYGAELVGTVIRVEVNRRLYDIRIDEVHNNTPYWTELDSGNAESYRFVWTAVDDPTRSGELCATDVSDDPLWNHAFHAVVFEGEKYDPVTRDITLTGKTTHVAPFNIACFGSLPAKQELTRRTEATIDATHSTTIDDDRQNLARAWAAEYCGGGHAFTHQGHKLRIRDRREWLVKAAPLGWSEAEAAGSEFHYEAVWADGHAICLDTPRLAVKDPTVPTDARIYDRIVAECGELPPPCTGQPWFPDDWKSHGDFLTATVGQQLVFP
jgi:hypothetical protein